jgi:hypothetical protein
MARIRNVKPEFFTSESVAELTFRQRLTWIGLWTHADNFGRARDNVRVIKGAVWPIDDVSYEDIEEDLVALAERDRILRYEVEGKRYLMVTNWDEHQYGAGKGAPKHPGPEMSGHGPNFSGPTGGGQPVDNSENGGGNGDGPAGKEKSGRDLNFSRAGQDNSSGIQGSGVRGQGEGTRETATRPPSKCLKHMNHPDPPACGRCGDARRFAEQWDTERKQSSVTDRGAVRACRSCDGDGWRYEPGGRHRGVTGERCDHSPPEPVEAS